MNDTAIGLKKWIGIDGGGTKTNCIIGDENGNLYSMSIGTSSNMQSVQPEQVCSTLTELINKVILDSNSEFEQIESISLCLAGVDRDIDKDSIKTFFNNTIYEKKLRINTDAKAALASGTWGEAGLLLIAGTGSIVYGINEETPIPLRVGGWGYLLGDEGSGFYIGKRALNAVFQSFDNRLPPTTLTDIILQHFGKEEITELISLYREENIVPNIASISKCVFEAAEKNDLIANGILNDAIDELVKMVAIAKLKFKSKNEVTLVLHGGLFSNNQFTQKVKNKLVEKIGELKIVQSELPAVVGAYLIALKESGIPINEDVKRNIRSSWKRMNQQFASRK